jgi:alginate O-acetyltransferase complex protein AlgI
MSLSAWLRDYLYIPLGGNRRGRVRTKINLMLTMALGGLWHGASWRFMAWGILHGTYLVGQRVPVPGLRKLKPAPLLCALFVFVLACIGWVFFRATSFAQAFHVCAQMLGLAGKGEFTLNRSTFLATCILAPIAFAFQWKSRNEDLDTTFDRFGSVIRTVILAGMLIALLFAPGDNRAFIYFQF